MRKRLLSILLVLCMSLTLLPGTAHADNALTSGTFESGVMWSFSDGILKIQGRGSMDNYDTPLETPWVDYRSQIHTVIICDNVTNIGDAAFYNCDSLTSVTIPDSVTSIGDRAFYGCSGLTGVTIPDSVIFISDNAFSHCSGLSSIVIPSGVTIIKKAAFYNCRSLTTVTIPRGVTTIEDTAFAGCSALTSITIPDTVTDIGFQAFVGCRSLTKITIPGSVTSMGAFTFKEFGESTSGGPTTAGPIGDGYDYEFGWTSTIPANAFANCIRLTSVMIPSTIASIGNGAFHGCESLTSVTIPSGVTNIEVNTFRRCNSLSSIVIPSGVTNIGASAFEDCGLTNITIPSSVTNIGDNAFYNCTRLSDIYYSGNERDWNAITIGINNYRLTNATIHYNSTEPGGQGGGNDPGPIVPSTPDTDTNLTSISIPFYSGLGGKSNEINIDWGWSLFDAPALTSVEYKTYDNRLAITSLALSAASEQSQVQAESLLRQLGFADIISYNYNQLPFIIAQPGVTFGHNRLIVAGEERHIFATVVRGTTNVADIMTDIYSLAGAFQVSGQNVYDLLIDYIRDSCHLSLDKIAGNARFFVTGHSLGGATSNVLAKKLNESFGAQKVFAYTFASPTTAFSGSDTGESGNIYNVLNREDIVPLLPPTLWDRYGLSVWFSRNNYTEMYQHFSTLTNNEDLRAVMESIWLWDELSKISYAHATETYMSFLLALSDDATLGEYHTGSGGGVWCPVDLEIYVETNGGPMLVGRIKDNVIDEEVTTGIVLRVDGDKKYFYFPLDGEYTIKLTGSEDDTMTFFVQEMDYNTGEPIEGTGTVFENVILEDGKQFTSEIKVETGIATGTTTPDVKLYVLDNNTGEPEKEVLPDGKGTELPLEGSTITFNANGGTVSPAAAITGTDGKLSSLPTPTRSGYTFKGWYTAAEGGTEVTKGTVFTEDTIIYAHWTKNETPSDPKVTYTITLNSSPTGGGSVTGSGTYDAGQSVTVKVAPASGYSFVRWTENDQQVSTRAEYTFNVTKNRTLTAVFERISSGTSSGSSGGGSSRPSVKQPSSTTTTTPVTPNTPPSVFSDVPASHIFAAEITWARDNGIMGGYSDGTFRPNANTNRQQMWMVLARMAGANPSNMTEARTWAVNSGISDGTNSESVMSRQQLVTMLYRFAQTQGVTISGSADLSSYPDNGVVSAYATEALAWAVGNGIVTGTPDGRLNPEGTATRAHFAAFLYRYNNLISSAGLDNSEG